MGVSASTLLDEEKETLASFSSAEAWAFDSEKWQNLLRWKVYPWTLSGDALRGELQPYASRLIAHGSSRNFATLAAHVALRLPKTWFFSRTDVWMTTTAVTLLRVFAQLVFASLPYEEALPYFLSRPNAPAGTSVVELESWSWPDIVASCIDYLSAGTVDTHQYDLHVAVLELMLVLFSPQSALGEPLLKGVELPAKPATGRHSAATIDELMADAAVDGALEQLRTGQTGSRGMTDAFLRAAMVQGSYLFVLDPGAPRSHHSLNTSTGDAPGAGGTPSRARARGGRTAAEHPAAAVAAAADAAGATRAHVLCRALLRNVCVDGTRNDDSEGPQPTDDSAAGKASLAVVELRSAALKAHSVAAAAAASGFVGGKPGIVDNALSVVGSVFNAATAVASLPVTMVADVISPGPGSPVGKPLAERSALLLLLLLHNCRANVGPTDESGQGSARTAAYLPNPFRAALDRIVDSGIKEQTFDEAAAASAVTRSQNAATGVVKAVGSGPGLASSTNSLGLRSRDVNLCLLGVPFPQLFLALSTLCGVGPLGTALLYTLQHGCAPWRAHTLSRTDIDALLLPVLEQLYRLEALPHDDRYMALITLMMFTQDAAFCETAFRRVTVPARTVSTLYAEKRLGDISLGSLMLLVLQRAAALVSIGTSEGPAASATPTARTTATVHQPSPALHASMVLNVDPHALGTLHQNMFAACVNMAPYAESLHPATCQRILSTVSGLHRRHKRIETRLHALMAAVGAPPDANTISLTPAVLPDAAAALGLPIGSTTETIHAAIFRLSSTADVFARSVDLGLEMLLACTAPTALPRNTHLLYALLRDASAVRALAADPTFQRHAAALCAMVTHFESLVARAQIDRRLALALLGSGGAEEAESLRAAKASQDAAARAEAEVALGDGTSTLPSASAAVDAAVGVPWEEGDVTAVLVSGAKSGTWPGSDKAAAAAQDSVDHIFEYAEAPSSEAFFVPYLWTLAYGYTRGSVGWTEKDMAGIAGQGQEGVGPAPLFVFPRGVVPPAKRANA